MSRSIFVRKTAPYKISTFDFSNQLYATAMMPNEGQVRDKMEQICQRELGKTLSQMSIAELEQAKSQSDSLVEKELSGFEKMMLGGDGIAEGKRLAKKILDEEIAKRPAESPSTQSYKPDQYAQSGYTQPQAGYTQPQQPQAGYTQPQQPSQQNIQVEPPEALQSQQTAISPALQSFLTQKNIKLDVKKLGFDEFISQLVDQVKFSRKDLRVINLELVIRRLEAKNPYDPKIRELERKMPNSTNRQSLLNMSNEELTAIYQEYY